MIRQAIAADGASIDAFLARYAETSMFLRSNLAQFGIGKSTEPRASTYWIEIEDNQIQGVFGKSNHGYLMVQAPKASEDFWGTIVDLLAGAKIQGMTGVPAQVEAAFAAFGLTDAMFSVNKDEPLYSVALSDVPKTDAYMRTAVKADFTLLTEWFAGYLMDTGLVASQGKVRLESTKRAHDAVGNSDVMLLIEQDRPVAMAGINGRAADLVQIGGVYTPPPARGKGLARRAVAGLLSQQKHANRSILFAADTAAAKAYEAIGYRRIGTYRVAMLKEMHAIGSAQ